MRTTLVLGSLVCSVLLIGPANAVSINPGEVNPLTTGSDYTAAPTASDVGTGSFSFDYLFDVPAGVTTEIFASSHQPFPDPGDPEIDNLTFSWLDASGNPLPGASNLVVTDANGQTLADKLVFGLVAGGQPGADYILRVAGDASNNGRFDFDLLGLNAPIGTPAPSAIWLFGSAMVCLSLLVRERGRSKARH